MGTAHKGEPSQLVRAILYRLQQELEDMQAQPTDRGRQIVINIGPGFGQASIKVDKVIELKAR